MPMEGTPTQYRPGPVVETPLSECRECRRQFVVPTNVLKVVTRTSYRVELTCTNCGWSHIGTHHEDELEALDRALDRQTADMQAALELWRLTREIERIDAFARALQDDHILPEDF
jgi:hypothetical protein